MADWIAKLKFHGFWGDTFVIRIPVPLDFAFKSGGSLGFCLQVCSGRYSIAGLVMTLAMCTSKWLWKKQSLPWIFMTATAPEGKLCGVAGKFESLCRVRTCEAFLTCHGLVWHADRRIMCTQLVEANGIPTKEELYRQQREPVQSSPRQCSMQVDAQIMKQKRACTRSRYVVNI